LDSKQIFEALQGAVDHEIEQVEDSYGVKFKVKPEGLFDVLKACQQNPELACDALTNQTGIHVDEAIQLYYVLYSYAHHHELIVNCEVPLEGGKAPSVVELWPGADWLERETYDLLGVQFTGHPDLKRIMLPEDWEGHPLRKDYVFPEFYQGIDNRPSEITKSFQLK